MFKVLRWVHPAKSPFSYFRSMYFLYLKYFYITLSKEYADVSSRSWVSRSGKDSGGSYEHTNASRNERYLETRVLFAVCLLNHEPIHSGRSYLTSPSLFQPAETATQVIHRLGIYLRLQTFPTFTELHHVSKTYAAFDPKEEHVVDAYIVKVIWVFVYCFCSSRQSGKAPTERKSVQRRELLLWWLESIAWMAQFCEVLQDPIVNRHRESVKPHTPLLSIDYVIKNNTPYSTQ